MSDKMPTPLLLEKFLVTASSPNCKCVVTATSTLDGNVLSLPIHKCAKNHDAVIAQLAVVARDQVLFMVNRYNLLPHCGPSSVFGGQESTSSEGSNIHSTQARSFSK
jgi:hypothetical protein